VRLTHKFLSPYNPQNNGKIEATVKAMKKLSPHHGMANRWIMTICVPIQKYSKDSLSPAQLKTVWAPCARHTPCLQMLLCN